jgi:hypothetical protein
MKKTLKNLRSGLFSTFIFALALTSCKDKDKTEIPAPAGSALFADKSWKLQSITFNPAFDWNEDGVLDKDLVDLLEECDRDDLLIFKKSGKIVSNYGAKKCDPTEPAEEEDGSWTYDDTAKKLSIDQDGLQVWSILENSGNTLKLRYVVPDVSPELSLTMTLKTN